jgi:hypothetical protein
MCPTKHESMDTCGKTDIQFSKQAFHLGVLVVLLKSTECSGDPLTADEEHFPL